MKKGISVSVIIPVYKAESFLRHCIESVIGQTLQNIEIILVDDGSPDACPEICDEYKRADARVRVIHQANSGLACAYNAGLSAARGEYIGFVEADDFIAQDMYEVLYTDAITSKADVVKGNYFEYYDVTGKEPLIKPASSLLDIQPPQNPFTVYEYPAVLIHHPSIWTGLYSRKFLQKYNISFQDINRGFYVDQNWRYETLIQAQRIYWENKAFYHYRLTNPAATSHRGDNPDDIFNVYDRLELFLKKHPGQKEKIQQYLYFEIYHHLFWNAERVDKNYKAYALRRLHEKFTTMDTKTVESSSLFSKKEKKLFRIFQTNYYSLYLLGKKCSSFIFSINKSGYENCKVICLFGLKWRIKLPEKS